MREICRTMEVKEGKTYKQTFVDTDKASVYESLSHDLIVKKLCSCSYIKSIKRANNFDGTLTITVNYDNDTRCTYIVED